MEAIKFLSEEAFNYLNDIPACHWSRHAFSARSKSGMLLNNCCESFNNVLREARTKPILSLMEWIRRWVIQRCKAKREGLKKFHGLIMPSVKKMIEKMKENVAGLTVIPKFEVDDGEETFVVNLEKHTCDCYKWTLLGIPCLHAMACIVKRELGYQHSVHQAYHVATYATTYAPEFHGMPGKNLWEKIESLEPLPPPYIRSYLADHPKEREPWNLVKQKRRKVRTRS